MKKLITTQVSVIIDTSEKPKLDEKIKLNEVIYTLIIVGITGILVSFIKSNVMTVIIATIAAIGILIIACRFQDRKDKFDEEYCIDGILTVSKYNESIKLVIITNLKDKIQINLDTLMLSKYTKCTYDCVKSLLTIKNKNTKCYINHQLKNCGIKIKCKQDKLMLLLEKLGYELKYRDN